MAMVDLHVHSKCSDGALTIHELLKLAKERQMEEIAITDHETVINISNYQELEKEYAIRIIPGIEIPTSVKGLHILGYGIKKIAMLESFVNTFKSLNKEVAERTIKILNQYGIDISIEQVEKIMTSSILTKRDIVQYMVFKGYASTTYEVYQNFIGRGNKAYVPLKKIQPEAALDVIEKSGGISVVAHPSSLPKDTDFNVLIPYLKMLGVKGIETNTVRNNFKERKFFSELAKRYELFETAGTDFHNTIDGSMLGIDVEEGFLSGFHSSLK